MVSAHVLTLTIVLTLEQSRIGRRAEFGQLAMIDPRSKCLAMRVYEGQMKVCRLIRLNASQATAGHPHRRARQAAGLGRHQVARCSLIL
jgi:hypothetical protein